MESSTGLRIRNFTIHFLLIFNNIIHNSITDVMKMVANEAEVSRFTLKSRFGSQFLGKELYKNSFF